MDLVLFLAISGAIVDPTGAYIPGATVELRPGLEVRADNFGQFSIPGVPAGTYELRITHPGFYVARVGPVTVTAGSDSKLPNTVLRISAATIGCCGCSYAAPRFRYFSAPESRLEGIFTTSGGVLTLSKGDPQIIFRSDFDANFAFDGLSPGRYHLRATAPGFAPFEIKSLRIPRKTRVKIEGWIELPECRDPNGCPVTRKVARPDDSKIMICL